MFEETNETNFTINSSRTKACQQQCRLRFGDLRGCPCLGPNRCKFLNQPEDENSWFEDIRRYYSQIFSPSERKI